MKIKLMLLVCILLLGNSLVGCGQSIYPKSNNISARNSYETESKDCTSYDDMTSDIALDIKVPSKDNIPFLIGSYVANDFRTYYREEYHATQTGYRIASEYSIFDPLEKGKIKQWEFVSWNNDRLLGTPKDYYYSQQDSKIPSGKGEHLPSVTVDSMPLEIEGYYLAVRDTYIITAYFSQNDVHYMYTQEFNGRPNSLISYDIFRNMNDYRKRAVVPNSQLILCANYPNAEAVKQNLEHQLIMPSELDIQSDKCLFSSYNIYYSFKGSLVETGYYFFGANVGMECAFVCYDDTRELSAYVSNNITEFTVTDTATKTINDIDITVKRGKGISAENMISYSFCENGFNYYYYERIYTSLGA